MLDRFVAMPLSASVLSGCTADCVQRSREVRCQGRESTPRTGSLHLMLLCLPFILATATIPAQPVLAGQAADYTRDALANGDWKAAETDLTRQLNEDAGNDEARFGLAMVQFARTIENFGRHHHRYGLKPRQSVPFMRIPVPVNSSPDVPTYEIQRAALQTLLDDLAQVEKTLGKMQGKDVKIRFDLEKVRLDFRSTPDLAPNPEAEEPATLMSVVRGINPRIARGTASASQVVPFEVAFDRADALWLQGYCHLLSAGLEFALAYDWHETFARTAGLFYPRLKLPGEFVPPRPGGFVDNGMADGLAFIHEIRWQPVEPGRLSKAREHLKQVVALSRLSWQAIFAETDDDQEWIPAPAQKNAVMPTMQITQPRVDTWLAALDEFDAALDGRKLIPHWRFEKGVNLRRVLEEPRMFDLVLWATGHAALPYLEEGPVLSSTTWRTWENVFGGNFLMFAVYLN
jgi:hypothetical protein